MLAAGRHLSVPRRGSLSAADVQQGRRRLLCSGQVLLQHYRVVAARLHQRHIPSTIGLFVELFGVNRAVRLCMLAKSGAWLLLLLVCVSLSCLLLPACVGMPACIQLVACIHMWRN